MTYSLKAIPWDLAIFLLIAGGIALAVAAAKRKKHVPAAFGALVAFTVAYGSFVEPRIITVTGHEVVLPFNEHLTIAVISDIHVGPYKGRRFVQRLVDRVGAIAPDIVLLLGDYVYFGSDPLEAYAPLKRLRPPLGMFAVLGNHEHGCYTGNISRRKKFPGGFDMSLRVRRALERVGVVVLRNESRRVETGAGELFIAGVDDMCSGNDDLASALPAIERKAPIILLSHDPSVILDNRARYPHLIVAGHTHGGQIRLPFIGPLSPLPTQLPREYDQGLFAVDGNTMLAITRGAGESGPRARLFAWPEVMVLKVQP